LASLFLLLRRKRGGGIYKGREGRGMLCLFLQIGFKGKNGQTRRSREEGRKWLVFSTIVAARKKRGKLGPLSLPILIRERKEKGKPSLFFYSTVWKGRSESQSVPVTIQKKKERRRS